MIKQRYSGSGSGRYSQSARSSRNGARLNRNEARSNRNGARLNFEPNRSGNTMSMGYRQSMMNAVNTGSHRVKQEEEEEEEDAIMLSCELMKEGVFGGIMRGKEGRESNEIQSNLERVYR